MKPGGRALGVAESYRGDRSTLAGAVVRADRVVDGFVFGQCTVGGTDATEAVVDLLERLDRPDVNAVLVAGIAPAWFNIVDLHRLHEAADRPVLSVSFEASEGLADDIADAFEGEAATERLTVYRAQPERAPVALEATTAYVRAVGVDAPGAADIVRSLTPEGGRPEPLRVARLAARAGDDARRSWTEDTEPP